MAFISLRNLFDAIRGRYNNEPNLVQLTGSNMEHFGASIGDRPDINTVPEGAEFIIIDDAGEFPAWKSNGIKWVEV